MVMCALFMSVQPVRVPAQVEVRYKIRQIISATVEVPILPLAAFGANFPLVPQVNFEYILADNAFGEGTGSFGLGAVGGVELYSIESSNVTAFICQRAR